MTPKPRSRGFFRHGFKNVGVCANCGRACPTTRHHVDGRRHSDEQLELCQECHDQLHPDEHWLKRQRAKEEE